MSLDDLRADLKRNAAEAAGLTSIDQVRDHLVNTLWPWAEAVVDVVEEIDDATAELVDQQEDYIQPETAAVFAAVAQSSLALCAELKKHGDAATLKLVADHEKLCEQAQELIESITMAPPDEAPEPAGDA